MNLRNSKILWMIVNWDNYDTHLYSSYSDMKVAHFKSSKERIAIRGIKVYVKWFIGIAHHIIPGYIPGHELLEIRSGITQYTEGWLCD